MRRLFVVSLFLLVVASRSPSVERFSVRDLLFLTRDGCVNTVTMRSRLDDALRSLGLPTSYGLVDVDKLNPSDQRRGYGTPTVLYKNRDLFGMTPPKAPGAPS